GPPNDSSPIFAKTLNASRRVGVGTLMVSRP
ncbi:MAG: hypothetical protein ACI932_002779, partial [Paracoccaceae bacterium]